MPGSVSQNENILKYCKNKEVPQSVAPVAPVAPSVAPSVVPMTLNPRREISQTANILKYRTWDTHEIYVCLTVKICVDAEKYGTNKSSRDIS